MSEFAQLATEFITKHEGLNQPGRWPGGSSGVTLGRGYDLAHHSREELERDWGSYLPAWHIARLAKAIGKTGTEAAAKAPLFNDIHVSMNAADAVFAAASLPKYEALARQAFPNMTALPEAAQIALISLVYNRGPSIDESDPRRAEMDAIAEILSDGVQRGDLAAIACQLRSMKRLWEGKGIAGLITRREDEAQLVESCIL